MIVRKLYPVAFLLFTKKLLYPLYLYHRSIVHFTPPIYFFIESFSSGPKSQPEKEGFYVFIYPMLKNFSTPQKKHRK